MLVSKADSELLAQILNSRPAYGWIAEVNDLDNEDLYQATLKIEDLKQEWLSEFGIKVLTYAPVGHGLLHADRNYPD